LNYHKKFPVVRVELVLTDRNVDLVSEGIDLAIRAGSLQDSILISKKIGVSYFALYASPQYLKKNEELQHPKDLKNHKCIQFTALGKEKWTLTNSKERQSVSIPLDATFVIDDLTTIRQMTLSHQGISLLPTFSCLEKTKSNQLVRVLPDWKTEVKPISFVYPSSKFMLPKLKEFIIFAEQSIKLQLNE
jgi:DNA-binding transcriptional LysR family regulator